MTEEKNPNEKNENIKSKKRNRSSLKGSISEQIANIITSMIAVKEWQFYASEDEISADKIAGPQHMLPALMWQVEKMHRIAYGGISTGISFEKKSDNVLGAEVVFPEGRARSPLLLFAQEALQRAHDNHPKYGGASVDHMVQEFLDDRDQGLLPMINEKPLEKQASAQAGRAA